MEQGAHLAQSRCTRKLGLGCVYPTTAPRQSLQAPGEATPSAVCVLAAWLPTPQPTPAHSCLPSPQAHKAHAAPVEKWSLLFHLSSLGWRPPQKHGSVAPCDFPVR